LTQGMAAITVKF